MAERQTLSLRWRLFLMLSASTLAVWLGVSWVVHEQLSHEVDEIYDGQLLQAGRILTGIIRAGAGKIELTELRTALPKATFDGKPQIHATIDREIRHAGKYERVIGFQIVDRAGTLLFRSPGSPLGAFAASRESGFSDTEVDGVRWRLCSFHDKALDRVVHIGEQYAVRREISRYLLLSMAMPVLLGVVAIGTVIWLSLNWGLKPLSKLARQLQERKADDLAPIEPDSMSSETRAIVDSIDGLFARIRNSFDRERRFTGDAAHELRTPLAALKVQSQVALRATNKNERTRALNGIVTGVDRATHLVNQLLDLSRLDWQQRFEADDILSLTAIAESVASGLNPCAREKGIRIVGGGDPETLICADEALVSMLLRNLLDNAVRYSSPGDRVDWAVLRKPPSVTLEITDTGPGIPPDERHRAFERFRRLPDSRARGAGLGLSIVREIADLYDAEVFLTDPTAGPGLRVLVSFPLASNKDK